MPTPVKFTFTGRRRHKVLTRWFHKPVLVLQLEVEGNIYDNSGGRVESQLGKWWIDALPENLNVEKLA